MYGKIIRGDGNDCAQLWIKRRDSPLWIFTMSKRTIYCLNVYKLNGRYCVQNKSFHSLFLFDVNFKCCWPLFLFFFATVVCRFAFRRHKNKLNIAPFAIENDKKKNFSHFAPFFSSSLPHRYKNLNNTVVTRGKVLHAAVHSLQSFDKSLDQVRRNIMEEWNSKEERESVCARICYHRVPLKSIFLLLWLLFSFTSRFGHCETCFKTLLKCLRFNLKIRRY